MKTISIFKIKWIMDSWVDIVSNSLSYNWKEWLYINFISNYLQFLSLDYYSGKYSCWVRIFWKFLSWLVPFFNIPLFLLTYFFLSCENVSWVYLFCQWCFILAFIWQWLEYLIFYKLHSHFQISGIWYSKLGLSRKYNNARIKGNNWRMVRSILLNELLQSYILFLDNVQISA